MSSVNDTIDVIDHAFNALCGKPLIEPQSANFNEELSTGSSKRKPDMRSIDFTPSNETGLSEKCSALFQSWQDTPGVSPLLDLVYPFIRYIDYRHS